MSTLSALLKPRVVVVTRKTPLQLLVERHGTIGQVRFHLSTRGHAPEILEAQQQLFDSALDLALRSIPPDLRRVHLDRDDLSRFLFAPDDILLIVGQDGLVPNAAKYLSGQLTIGVNPDPQSNDGVLCPHAPADVTALLAYALNASKPHPHFTVQRRTMASALREDGQSLLALNEIFIGHRSHQSARYLLTADRLTERHSSSGLICSTGTGATGWANSISRQRNLEQNLPGPTERALAWFVREPFPSVSTGTTMTYGRITGPEKLLIASAMPEGGLFFADGIETDFVEFLEGSSVTLKVSDQCLNLIIKSQDTKRDPRQRTRPPDQGTWHPNLLRQPAPLRGTSRASKPNAFFPTGDAAPVRRPKPRPKK